MEISCPTRCSIDPLHILENLPQCVRENVTRLLGPEELSKLRTVNKTAQIIVDNTSHGAFLLFAKRLRANNSVEHIYDAAAILACPETLQWIEERHGRVFGARACAAAACFGKLDALKWFQDHAYAWDQETCAEAARKGHLDVLAWAREEGCPWGEKTFESAVDGGHEHVLIWISEQRPPCPWDERSCQKAAEKGNLKLLTWLREKGCPWNGNVLYEAARAGSSIILEWSIKKGCPRDSSLISCVMMATMEGDLHTLKMLKRYGCLVGTQHELCDFAARYAHLHILRWAQKNHFPWSESTCASAAAAGDLTILKWLRGNGCAWDVNTCTEAAMSGHLPVLIWARKQDPPAPWSEVTFEWALCGGNTEVVRWLEENKCPRRAQ